MDVFTIFFSVIAALAAILGGVIFTRRKKRKENVLMAFLLFVFTIYLCISIAFWTFPIRKIVHLNFTYLLPISLTGPLFFMYIRGLFKKENMSKTLIFLYALPFLVTLIIYSRYYFQSQEKKYIIFENGLFSEYIFFYDYLFIYKYLLIGFMIFCGVKSFLIYRALSDDDRDMRIWTKLITTSFICIAISFLLYYVIMDLQLLTLNRDYFISLLMSVFILLVGYFAYVHPLIFNGIPIEEVIPFIKYKKSGLSKEYSLSLKLKLERYMEQDQAFQNSDIRLSDIAEVLHISRNHASQVINEHFDLSFWDYINKYRIEQAKEIIQSQPSQRFTEMAYTVGFNNRISFYKAFKKFEGCSPSQYLKSLTSMNTSSK